MVKIAIRDDDMNFFTKVEDIEQLYGSYTDFPISFAVIPMVIDVSRYGYCSDTRGNKSPRWVGDNQKLKDWLKVQLRQRKADVLLHGITHEYKFIGKHSYPEMIWRKEPELKEEILRYKNDLSNELDYNVTVFVAPSNKISKYCINSVATSGMNFSGIIPIGFNRNYTVRNISNYVKRWCFRAIDGVPYPNVLNYSTHKELNACIPQSFDYLVKMFHYCEKMKSPMAINVHYWYLRDHPEEKDKLFRFIDYALAHGAIPATMSELFV